jgi:hypothetical protein
MLLRRVLLLVWMVNLHPTLVNMDEGSPIVGLRMVRVWWRVETTGSLSALGIGWQLSISASNGVGIIWLLSEPQRA